MSRPVLYGLLGVVAAAAAVLSFAALRDLAAVCGFGAQLAWLLPVVVDAGAAAGSLVWLGGTTARAARVFARALALGLLGLSVAANALGHGLAAFALSPPWWVVVIVSAIAPAVLGAVVHLAVLVGRHTDPVPDTDEQAADADRVTALIAEGAGRRRLSREPDITEHEARQLLARNRAVPGPGTNEDAAAALAHTSNGSGAPS